MSARSVFLGDDLTITIPARVARLSPNDGITLGLRLIRRAVRQAVVEEVARAAPCGRPTPKAVNVAGGSR
jgi:hypothetical protein